MQPLKPVEASLTRGYTAQQRYTLLWQVLMLWLRGQQDTSGGEGKTAAHIALISTHWPFAATKNCTKRFNIFTSWGRLECFWYFDSCFCLFLRLQGNLGNLANMPSVSGYLTSTMGKKCGRPIIRQLELGLTVKHANLNLQYNTHINILDTIIISWQFTQKD